MGANNTTQIRGIFEASAWLTRGQQASDACRFEEAREAYVHALKLMPQSIDALRGLGFALFQLRRLSEALEMLQQALRVEPSDLLSRLLMGRICLRLQQPGGAIEHFQIILKRIDNSAAARSGLVDAYLALGQMSKADELCQKMLREKTQSEIGHMVAARLATLKRDDDASLQHFERLVEMQPANPAHRYNRGLCLLRMGRFEEGWKDYEHRFAAGAVTLRQPATPRWDGRPIDRLLILAEQGFGDMILFGRFVADAAQHAGQVTVMCPPPLLGLFSRSLGCTCVSDQDAWPEHDAFVPMMSLPWVLGLGASAAAPRDAYLTADALRIDRLHGRLPTREGGRLRIGIVHATSAAHSTEENPFTRRSCHPKDLVVADIDHVDLYNLNVGKPAEEARAELAGLRSLPEAIGDFDDTAAAVSCMDAVISVDTAAAHLAGAFGKPVFVLLPPVPDWRWQPRGSGAPWYRRADLIPSTEERTWTAALQQAINRRFGTFGAA